ncbi:unnamed protein product [Brassicogethes aeneus]|uniref:Uncharacterized protein n=1 Tax=Brassicogethes aeneus TaxID=1431903 RepID=A0A9P0BBX5_BRAAE|nr:unnamed protein product [Brassicogethes aeneus]
MEEKLVKITKCPDNEKKVISKFKKKSTAASYKKERFLKNNKKWITASIELPYWSVQPTEKPGRPTKTFEELSDSSSVKKQKNYDTDTCRGVDICSRKEEKTDEEEEEAGEEEDEADEEEDEQFV